MKQRNNVFRKLVSLIRQMDSHILWLYAARSVVSALLPFGTILLSGAVIQRLVDGEPFQRIICFALLGVAAIFLGYALRDLLHRTCQIRMQACVRKYDTLLGEKTLNMEYAALEDERLQGVRQRIAEDNNWGYGLYGMLNLFDLLTQRVVALVAAFWIVLPMLQLDYKICVACVVYFAVLLGITFALSKQRSNASKKQVEWMGEVNKFNRLIGYFTANASLDYRAGKEIRLYKAYDLLEVNAASSYYHMRRVVSSKIAALLGRCDGTAGLLSGLCEGVAYAFVALHALAGRISLGQVVTYAGAINQFARALSGLVMQWDAMRIHAERFLSTFEYMDLPDTAQPGTEPIPEGPGVIEFQHVSFRYPGAERFALEDVNLILHPGEHIAVVGENGSGKTTMVKLLCRLFVPTQGKILLDGQDIQQMDFDAYMARLSVVFQDFKLLSFTLGQNVSMAEEYDVGRAEECLKAAGFDERRGTMSDGLDTPLYKDYAQNGVELSGGEAQKIAIARALYKNAPLVVLDEPTAALDPLAEYEIYTRFGALTQNKTAIFISHRLSSCRFCDTIVVFDNGCVIEQGSHSQLLNHQGKYSELWNAQAQYYTSEAHAQRTD